MIDWFIDWLIVLRFTLYFFIFSTNITHCPSRHIPWKKFFLILNRLNYFKLIPSHILETFWIAEMFSILGAKYRFSLMWVIIRFWYPAGSSHNYSRIETCNRKNISLKIIINFLVILIKTKQSSPNQLSTTFQSAVMSPVQLMHFISVPNYVRFHTCRLSLNPLDISSR